MRFELEKTRNPDPYLVLFRTIYTIKPIVNLQKSLNALIKQLNSTQRFY